MFHIPTFERARIWSLIRPPKPYLNPCHNQRVADAGASGKEHSVMPEARAGRQKTKRPSILERQTVPMGPWPGRRQAILSVGFRPLPQTTPITRLTLPTCHAHYPDRPERVRLSVASPLLSGLPRISGGSASMTSLSRPAQASRALRPAGLLDRPIAAFVTRLRPAGLPRQTGRLLPGPTDNFLGGSFLHW